MTHFLANTIAAIAMMCLISTANATSYGTPPSEAADVIVVFTPSKYQAFNAASMVDRGIAGTVNSVDKGEVKNLNIMHLKNSFTSPLLPGVPVRLYLKKYPDRDAYYLIGVGAP